MRAEVPVPVEEVARLVLALELARRALAAPVEELVLPEVMAATVATAAATAALVAAPVVVFNRAE